MPMKSMQMSFEATCQCAFLYETWSTKSNECGAYTWALILIGLFSFVIDTVPLVRDYYRSKVCDADGKIQGLLHYLGLGILEGIWTLGNLLSMLLLMSFNVGVIMVILSCKVLCYMAVGVSKDMKTTSQYH